MGFLKKIKEFFSKDKEVVVSTPEKVINEKPIVDIISKENYGEKIEACFKCGDSIETWEKRKTFAGNKFHKECFRELIKEGKKQINI